MITSVDEACQIKPVLFDIQYSNSDNHVKASCSIAVS